MTVFARTLRRVMGRAGPTISVSPAPALRAAIPGHAPVEIAEKDPILAYLQSAPGPVDLGTLELSSPAADALRAAGIKLVVPLVAQGELIGTLNLGPRLSEQDYSSDDRRLLDQLAGQAAPALRVAQLVRQQEAEARERQKMEQELQVAQLIQQHFLPIELPQPAGWAVQAFYRPARAVGGDFYDIVERPDGTLTFVVGDVTDKGVPAAMVMAATRSLLRAAGRDVRQPGKVLERVNELLLPDIPERMFVTCLYGVLDPATGHIRFANAGHNLPFVCRNATTDELRATGMPLGLLPGMRYDEVEAHLAPGDQLVLTSDGIAEAHGPDHQMFGIPRLRDTIAAHADGRVLIQEVLDGLAQFTGSEWEQEDDITLVTIGREPARVLAAFELPSETGREREAMQRVADVAAGTGLSAERLEKLKTAVAEATMNAIEHGNGGRAEVPVAVEVVISGQDLVVRITDEGGDRPIPITETPDLDAKLSGQQSPRGWGLFLIQNMVDALRVISDGGRHTAELVMHLEGATDG